MLEKLKGTDAMKLLVWVAALVCITVLIALGKVKPETLEMLLMYLVGAVGKSTAGKFFDLDNSGQEGKSDEKAGS